MTTAQAAILAAWQPLLAAQHIDVRMILERHAEELARLAVQVVCPTEGERMVPRFNPGLASGVRAKDGEIAAVAAACSWRFDEIRGDQVWFRGADTDEIGPFQLGTVEWRTILALALRTTQSDFA